MGVSDGVAWAACGRRQRRQAVAGSERREAMAWRHDGGGDGGGEKAKRETKAAWRRAWRGGG